MTNPAKLIPLTLRLDPCRESERMALTTLQRWYQRAGELNGGHEEFDFFGLQLHTNIYLSGLHLCLLEPKLIKVLSSHLHSTNLTPEFLYQALERHQLVPADQPSVAEPAADSNTPTDPFGQISPESLVNSIVDQLHPLLNAQSETNASAEQNAWLQAQLHIMTQQLQEQGRLLQEQTRLLGALNLGSGPRPASQEGERGAANPEQLHNLSATAAKVRKVREKGVF
jgi:hypothetical protein